MSVVFGGEGTVEGPGSRAGGRAVSTAGAVQGTARKYSGVKGLGGRATVTAFLSG